ncbi:formylglycine-generating enzyme family protein [Streptomyces sp. NPDC004609]|uniref:formylglycine-generating enzyme family protein n=1 Tax=Streptomyces sp. NPDC004609 TaxID=3364704 RepID=UPI0036CE9F62
MGVCCGPGREPADLVAAGRPVVDAPGAEPDVGLVHLEGGSFRMGDAFGEGYASDGESPVHTVLLDPFAIGATTVTNAEFAAFVAETDYRTDAERYGSSAVFHLALRARAHDVLGHAAGASWWLNVQGADWAHPGGRRSRWEDVPDHPVVHVSWHDAVSYCRWAGARLPSEAEWEYAARGGRSGSRYPWGDEPTPDGEDRCNIWHGTFPTHNTLRDGFLTTAPVRSFPPNGFGLYEVAGNVWEWCGDWYSPAYYAHSPRRAPQGPSSGDTRVIRGGSYLCHRSYCNRYRVAARSANTPDSSVGNCGFRIVRNGSDPRTED